jgi:hypothetical protein
MNDREDILGLLPPRLSARKVEEEARELFFEKATAEQLATVEYEFPELYRRGAVAIMNEYIDDLTWLKSRRTRRGKRGGRPKPS